MTLHRRLRNSSQWISIAQFLSKDPLRALGLEGGWSRSVVGSAAALACDGPKPGPGPELNTPPSNTGVNKVGDVARVESWDRQECFRCVLVAGDEVLVDQCQACKQ
jgi:hypothetical protein